MFLPWLWILPLAVKFYSRDNSLPLWHSLKQISPADLYVHQKCSHLWFASGELLNYLFTEIAEKSQSIFIYLLHIISTLFPFFQFLLNNLWSWLNPFFPHKELRYSSAIPTLTVKVLLFCSYWSIKLFSIVPLRKHDQLLSHGHHWNLL